MKKLIFDSSTISLLFSNLVIIFLSFIQKWEVSTILWVYWIQSIIIGFFQFLKILSLKKFSTENFTINNEPALPTSQTKVSTAFFFLFHYGFFHFIYAIFLASVIAKTPENFLSILTGSTIFFLNHFYSFVHNKINDQKLTPNIGHLMFAPYLRIIPMHLVIVIGALLTNQALLVVFLFLKTFTDLLAHIFKHDLLTVRTPQT